MSIYINFRGLCLLRPVINIVFTSKVKYCCHQYASLLNELIDGIRGDELVHDKQDF